MRTNTEGFAPRAAYAGWRAACIAAAVAAGVDVVSLAAQPRGFELAFYNIRSGKGMQPLRGRPAPFAESDFCTGEGRPMNAWGAGVVQKELAASIASDPRVVALGLTEAWVCASPKQVVAELKWKTATEERNGTALLARFGLAGTPEWLKLDTSRNENPRDEMWVVRAAVCLDTPCSESLDVYAAHWSGTGSERVATFDRQARDTIAFMRGSSGRHVLIGDLNIFEGDRPVCSQEPNNSTLGLLRTAGYTDAWAALHGSAEGFTGMLNRAGCGAPEGYPWKRIDYAWSKGLTPIAMRRFGTVPAGEAAPSDHVGIIVEYR
jgi:endonuclease/exonuclease/phosphatase family metal-dependent hydrolase